MIIVKKPSKVVQIPFKVIACDTFFPRLRGLMFRRSFADEAIWLSPCNSIHMFFMFFPIDVVFLNEAKQIIYLKEYVRPWSVIFPVANAQSALELPAGTIQKFTIEINDSINSSQYN